MAFSIASTARIVSSISVCPNRRVLLFSRRPTSRISVQKPVQCIASPEIDASTAVRRSGNYKPTSWDEDHLLSLTNEYMGDIYREKAEKLTEQLRMMIKNADKDSPLKQLELVDNLQRLGLAHHFENEIGNILNNVHKNSDDKWKKGNLYATSLEFRLLRQHSYNISEAVFNGFKDATGGFKACLGDDIKAILGFYEASFYGLEGESIMEEAWQCTSKYLKELDMKDMEPNMALQVKHALDLPLHWWPPRADTRWFIDFYGRREDKNHLLLDLAKLDFNIVQAIHQEDLKDTVRWWRDTGLGNLSFVRDRLVAAYLWAVGIAHEPQYSYTRKIITKAIALITAIDDIYDVYGTLPELELLSDTIKRWDIKAMKQLPSYMKTSYLALYNFINEMAYHILKEQDSDVTEHLMKIVYDAMYIGQWEDIAEAQIVEARWFHSQYKPTFEEYMENAYVSVTGPAISTLAYLSATNPIVEKEVEFLESHPPFVKWASKTFRLQDDLGTSKDELKRGDIPKAVQCYMNETGCSNVAGREHIQHLTRQWWKKLNLLRTYENSPLPKNITEMILNLLRISHLVYLHGEDGHGVEGQGIMNVMTSLFLQPIP